MPVTAKTAARPTRPPAETSAPAGRRAEPAIEKMEKNETGTQAIDRAMAVLFAFTSSQPAWRAVDLARHLGLNKSTVYRLLMALSTAGLMKRPTDASGLYRLGPAVLDLADTFLSSLDLRSEARPFIEQLVQEHGESVNLAVLSGSDAIKIDSALGTQTPQLMSRLGQRIPVLCSAAGKALLFDHSPEALRELFKTSPMAALTRTTITKPTAFIKKMNEWRSAGWAMNDEESEVGMRAIGAPIRDHNGRIVASISVSAPIFRVGDAKLTALGESVRDVAGQISAAMGNRARITGLHNSTF